MDDFRINHYCGEHLEIGYELSSKEQMEQHGSSSINKIGEPIVEARVVRESSAKDHNLAYHSVKILKTDNVLDGLTNLEIQQLSNQNAPPILSPTSISDSRKRKIKIHNAVIEKSEVKDNGVYSRDFKILKIIPSNIDDINDLNRIGDEIYIRKDFEEESSVEKQVAEYYTPLSSANSFVPHSISSTLTTRLKTQQHNLLPSVTKPLQTSYSTSEGTTVLHYPAPNYPETPSNKDFDDNSSSIGTEEDINLLYTNNGNVTNFKNYTITIREGDQYVIVFPTIAVPPSKGAFFPPKNLVFGKETFKMKDQYHESLQTTSYVTTTTPFKQVTLNELNETADNIKISKQSNLSKVEKENAFFISSTTTTFDMPAISSAMAIDFSNDLTSSHSTNATTMSTTDLTSSTSSESTEFGTMLSMPQRETTRTTTVGSQQSSSSTYGTSSLEINSTLGYQDISDEKDKIIKIDLPDSTVYEEDVDNSGLSSFEDETDDEYDDIRHLFATRSSYTSIQKTVFRKPLLHGFLMTPGYPKFYIGEINCKWEIHAPEGYKIRLSILDISLRDAEPFCKDYLEITDQVTSKTLLNSCAEEIRPVEIITNSHQVNVIVKTTTKFAYPKRGVLLHYSVLCISSPIVFYYKDCLLYTTTNYIHNANLINWR
ncbi:uncharacterized protein LOC129616468 [Condylostylus longicornis]|uniref:uncharacterized protein LOC129616468 n=1 Tax=Condylostylus longicornis TaxID=2530218 RepID=UPI00244DD51C|nr:uncharacterized protein LOC129616468 [Condylostylus longicornis]